MNKHILHTRPLREERRYFTAVAPQRTGELLAAKAALQVSVSLLRPFPKPFKDAKHADCGTPTTKKQETLTKMPNMPCMPRYMLMMMQ